jgi:hypothetical protein
MALWLIIIIMVGSAFIGAALTLHTAAKCKQTSGRMLEQYRDLLAEARQANEEKEEKKEKEKEKKADGVRAIKPLPSTGV